MRESIEAKQLRSRLGSYLNQVQDGLTLVVTRRGQAIAELRPYGLQQAGQEVQDEAQDEATPQLPASAGVSALGLTTYVCQMGQTDDMSAPDQEAEEDTSQEQVMPELQAQESQPE